MSGKVSYFAGMYNASDFAYGLNSKVGPLLCISGPNATGSGTVTLAFGYAQTPDGVIFNPLNTNAPITIGGDSSIETVTPSAVSTSTPTQYSTSSITATFTNLHGNGDLVSSGTAGLQEALNFCSLQGGGTVIVDAKWAKLGGTTAMIDAATIPSGVALLDNRSGFGGSNVVTVNIPNASVLTLNTVGYQLLPAPGAGNMYQVERLVVEQVAKTAAFTGGGNITAAYGTQASQTAATGTIAATVLTAGSGTTNQMGQALAVAVANGNSSVLVNAAVGLYAATADFATGGGSVIAKLTYRLLTGF